MMQSKPSVEKRILPEAERLALEAADRIIQAAGDAVRERGRFLLALTGGSTPEKSYALLARPERRGQIDWSRSFLFFTDERFVPHDDPRSNYHMANRSLLTPAGVPPDHVFAIPTHTGSPAASAAAYTQTLRQVFGQAVDKPLRFDLVLLGMGDDGHVASLFPGMPTLHENRLWVTSSPPGVLPPPVDRVTVTFPVLNAARQVLFQVAGASKAAALRDVWEGQPAIETRPAVGVRPQDGSVLWLVDKAAASGLTAAVP
jgi:6-phosphogluconolactonase